MKTIPLLAAVLFVTTFVFAQPDTRSKSFFSFIENGKTGYINSQGEIVIKPIFINGSEFSEGLACGRIGGYYGFFDDIGDTVIPFQFDYATPFSDGLALVYVDGQPMYIGHDGKKAFDLPAPAVGIFSNGRALVQTDSKQWGLINTRGQLVLDTIYSHIDDFVNGYAVVETTEKSGNPDEEPVTQMAVVDRNGELIVAFGKYFDIYPYSEGYFRVRIAGEDQNSEEYYRHYGFVDTTGRLVADLQLERNCSIDGDIHNGLATINLYKNWIPEEQGILYSSEKSYDGFINLKGEIIFNDTLCERVTDFSCNRAFIAHDYWNLLMINTKGERIGTDTFNKVHEQGFVNGLAFVSVDNKWGLIDTNARFVISPQYDEIGETGLIEDYFFFSKRIPNESQGNYLEKWGIARKDGSLILDAVLDYIAPEGFTGELAFCIIDGLPAYINRNGQIAWKGQKNTARPNERYDIDFMNRGYFYAHSEPDESDLGGFAKADNGAQKINRSMQLPKNKMSVTVKVNKEGIPAVADVIVANHSNKNIQLNAQDSRLYMKMQALDKNGQWKDIEYLPNSWCGNSYHILTLKKQEYWSFVAPVYEGVLKTKLRIALTYIDPKKSKNLKEDTDGFDYMDLDEKPRKSKSKPRKIIEKTIYSNEFDGSVNPGQFWRRPGYSPRGIMDPYNE